MTNFNSGKKLPFMLPIGSLVAIIISFVIYWLTIRSLSSKVEKLKKELVEREKNKNK